MCILTPCQLPQSPILTRPARILSDGEFHKHGRSRPHKLRQAPLARLKRDEAPQQRWHSADLSCSSLALAFFLLAPTFGLPLPIDCKHPPPPVDWSGDTGVALASQALRSQESVRPGLSVTPGDSPFWQHRDPASESPYPCERGGSWPLRAPHFRADADTDVNASQFRPILADRSSRL